MHSCPFCHQALAQETRSQEPKVLEHCPSCGLSWLDFGGQQPAIYRQLEEQVRRWEAGVAERHSAA
ncbi:MAG: hypothetical protein ACO1RX_09935 [Candidatus Sericytochromatia bacterium]